MPINAVLDVFPQKYNEISTIASSLWQKKNIFTFGRTSKSFLLEKPKSANLPEIRYTWQHCN